MLHIIQMNMFLKAYILLLQMYDHVFDQTLFFTSSVTTEAEEPEQIQEETITDTIEPLEIGKLLAHFSVN